MDIVIESPLPWVPVRQEHGTKWWFCLDDYAFYLTINGVKYRFLVPKGFRYDRASIPDWLEWLVSKDDLGCLGPLIHDLLFSCEGWAEPYTGIERRFTRAEANEIFYAVMIEDKVRAWRAHKAYHAVCLFSRRW